MAFKILLIRFILEPGKENGILRYRAEIMVRHIILWNLKNELTPEEKEAAKKEIKEGLEDLQGKIDGLVSIRVFTEVLPSSNTDIMLESVHEDRDALKLYAGHPLHIAVKDNIIVPKVSGRFAIDIE